MFRGPAAQALAVCLFVVLTWCFYASFRDDQAISGQWGCEMSWMTPSYQLIDWPDRPTQRYRLYLYREQGWDVASPQDGSPVIFVPGNAGSYQQVRSIASAAARGYYKSEGRNDARLSSNTQLDFFTVDFNEEFSAFHSGSLREQAIFVADAVDKVARLYGSERPSVLLGHSMGGIAARLASTMRNALLVTSIITLSTPHAYPPLAFDKGFESIYGEIHAAQRTTPLLSICGGVSDVQIASDACRLEAGHPEAGLSIMTSGIAGAWTSVDHQAIVWCHQIRSAVAQLLLRSAHRPRDLLDEAKELLVERGYASRDKPSQSTRSFPPIPHDQIYMLRDPRHSGPPDQLSMRQCASGVCSVLDHSTLAWPRPRDPFRPFPVPGEGVSESDIVYLLSPRGAVHHDSLVHLDGLSADTELITGTHTKEVAPGRSWEAKPASPAGLRLSVHFPAVALSSLVVWRARIETSGCEARPATVRVSAVSSRSDLLDQQFHVLGAEDIRIHFHLADAPYLEPVRADLYIGIVQESPCSVRKIELVVDYWASLGKLPLRFRTAAITWSLGWSSIMLCWQAEEPSIQRSQPVGRIVRLALGLSFSLLVAILVPTVGRHILLGSSDPLHVLSSFTLLATWSLGLAVLLRTFAAVMSAFGGGASAEGPNKGSNIIRVGLLALCCLVWLGVPSEAAMCCLTIANTFVSGHRRSSRTRQQAAAFGILALPLYAAETIAWPRRLMGDWRSYSGGIRPVLRIAPLVLMMVACTIQEQNTNTSRWRIRLNHAALTMFGCLALLLGARHPYVLKYGADVVFLSFAGVFIA